MIIKVKKLENFRFECEGWIFANEMDLADYIVVRTNEKPYTLEFI